MRELGGQRKPIRLGGLVCGLLLAVAIPGASAGSSQTQLTSVGSNGQVVHGDSSTYGVSVSGSGRFALFTVDDDGLPGAAATRDVYLRDRKRGKTRLVSQSTSGEPANQSCGDGPAISADGRFVAFTCDATNLDGGTRGVFVRDLRSKTTTLASRSSAGDPASDGGDRPALSADGRFVVFESNSDELPGAADTTDAYIRNLEKGRTRLVSQTTDGTPVEDNSTRQPAVSASGRYVAFHSTSDLLPGGTGNFDVYVRDLRRKKTLLVSKTSAGVPANGGSLLAPGAISGDGRFVAFESNAPNLGATPSDSAIVRDLKKHKSRVVSRTAGGAVADGEEPAMAAGGRFVAYDSTDPDLPGTDGILNAYRFDREAKKTMLLSRSGAGVPGDDDSFYTSLSADGGVAGFTSRADNLSGVDDNTVSNTFARIP